MKKICVAVVTSLFLFVVCKTIGVARAGETQVGIISVYDGGTLSNAQSGYGSPGCVEASCDKAFPLASRALLTVQPIGGTACVIATDRAGNDAGIGIELSAGQIFPTSLGGNTRVNLPDGGRYLGGSIAVSPPIGSASCRLKVSTRAGTE